MTYNIHPIFVHFPIAFLLLYSVIALVPVQRWLPNVQWKQLRSVLLVVGIVGAFAALQTGEIAEHLVQPNHQLVEMHSLFANISVFLYALLLVGDLLGWIKTYVFKHMTNMTAQTYYTKLHVILTHKTTVIVCSLLGLVAISVTGLLGGVLAYGLTADPVAPMILNVLGITL